MQTCIKCPGARGQSSGPEPRRLDPKWGCRWPRLSTLPEVLAARKLPPLQDLLPALQRLQGVSASCEATGVRAAVPQAADRQKEAGSTTAARLVAPNKSSADARGPCTERLIRSRPCALCLQSCQLRGGCVAPLAQTPVRRDHAMPTGRPRGDDALEVTSEDGPGSCVHGFVVSTEARQRRSKYLQLRARAPFGNRLHHSLHCNPRAPLDPTNGCRRCRSSGGCWASSGGRHASVRELGEKRLQKSIVPKLA
mmetsp:Transcript_128344/g.411311  ORF Transcript_128344/g.411311 Transcript_128344/m.411311 type:complete len:252 (+) Transcript_128344:867-1622(+)